MRPHQTACGSRERHPRDSESQAKCKENASKSLTGLAARFLKTMHISSAGLSLLYYQGEEMPNWNMPQHFFSHFTLSHELLPCPIPMTPACNDFWLHTFSRWHWAAVVFSRFYILWWMSLAFAEFHQSSSVCVIVGMRSNVVCLLLISALTN